MKILLFIVAFFLLIKIDGLVILPRALKSGDTVGFISPASTPQVDVKAYKEKVKNVMEKFGLKVKFGIHSFDYYGYLAGNDQARVDDIHAMFLDREVKAIIANRGGWGCNRIIDMINYTYIRNNPKILMGYSDLTGLINAVNFQTGLLTFHGPMGVSEWDEWESNFFSDVLMKGNLVKFTNLDGRSITTIYSGKAQGRLIGGNLSVFAAMLGSNFLPMPTSLNYILFLEEVDEQPYSVDRMLTNLHLSGWLKNAKGIVFGRCTNCNSTDPAHSFTVDQVLSQKFSNLKIPIFTGAMFGHIDSQYLLPLGAMVELDSVRGTITMLEKVVN